MKPAQFQRCNLFELSLREIIAHSGQGTVHSHRIASSADLSAACTFLDFTRVPPGSSIGEHTHAENEEEYYLILSGKGLMRQDSKEFPVTRGDLVRNRPGGTHALVNSGSEDVCLFVFEVRVP